LRAPPPVRLPQRGPPDLPSLPSARQGGLRALRPGSPTDRPLARGPGLRPLLHRRPAPPRHLRRLPAAASPGRPARPGGHHLRRLRRARRAAGQPHPRTCLRRLRHRGQALRARPLRAVRAAPAHRRAAVRRCRAHALRVLHGLRGDRDHLRPAQRAELAPQGRRRKGPDRAGHPHAPAHPRGPRRAPAPARRGLPARDPGRQPGAARPRRGTGAHRTLPLRAPRQHRPRPRPAPGRRVRHLAGAAQTTALRRAASTPAHLHPPGPPADQRRSPVPGLAHPAPRAPARSHPGRHRRLAGRRTRDLPGSRLPRLGRRARTLPTAARAPARTQPRRRHQRRRPLRPARPAAARCRPRAHRPGRWRAATALRPTPVPDHRDHHRPDHPPRPAGVPALRPPDGAH
jgi:hypothetical protein